MSFVTEQALAIEDAAIRAAIRAKAILPCESHDEVLIHQGDDEANRLAYAYATNDWKRNDIPCERTDLMDAVKDIIALSEEECPCCTRHRYED